MDREREREREIDEGFMMFVVLSVRCSVMKK